MFKALRLRKIHAKYLESSRNLKEGRTYWEGTGSFRTWLLQLVTPVPLMALHEDGKGLYEALLWLEENCRRRPVDEEALRHYHRMLAPKSPEPPGTYRKTGMSVRESKLSCPAPARIPALMRNFDITLKEEQARLDAASAPDPSDVLRTAVTLHHRLVSIHPFRDGNGRIARLAMNHILRRYGMGYVIFPPITDSREHFEALEEANSGHVQKLQTLAQECLYRV